MSRIRIACSRLHNRYSRLQRKTKLSAFLLFLLVLFLLSGNTVFGQKVRLLFSGNESVYQNLQILWNDDPLKVHIIDVGQGDASLIQYHGLNVLIDSGPPDSAMDLVTYLKALGINSIDFFILTHPHDDHSGGAPVIFQSFRVKRLLLPHDLKEDNYILEASVQAKAMNTEILISHKGLQFDLGSLSMTCLHPEMVPYSDVNDYSSVWSFSLGASRLLFLADLSSDVAEGLSLNGYSFVRSGHHGSKTSTTDSLLTSLTPRLVAISSGKGNKFGHPSTEVLALLKAHQIPYFRTDETGTTVLSSNGRTLHRVH